MRSQLFGFVVQTHLMYEFLLDCPLSQAVNTLSEFLRQFDSVVVGKPVASRFVTYLNDPLTVALEAHFNEWDEEVVQIVNGILVQDATAPEFLRMKRIEKSLSWLWPKVRETAVIGHFVFAVTIDNRLLLTVTFGWNRGPFPEDLVTVENIMPIFTQKIGQLGYMCQQISPPRKTEIPEPKRSYGPRSDTLISLKNLVEYRRKHITRQRVEVTLKRACEDNNLAMATVKKYAPILCERWYDQRYKGDVH